MGKKIDSAYFRKYETKQKPVVNKKVSIKSCKVCASSCTSQRKSCYQIQCIDEIYSYLKWCCESVDIFVSVRLKQHIFFTCLSYIFGIFRSLTFNHKERVVEVTILEW